MTASEQSEPDPLMLARDRVLEAARTEGKARRVLEGAPAGAVLAGRLSEFVAAETELHRAIDALAMAEGGQT